MFNLSAEKIAYKTIVKSRTPSSAFVLVKKEKSLDLPRIAHAMVKAIPKSKKPQKQMLKALSSSDMVLDGFIIDMIQEAKSETVLSV